MPKGSPIVFVGRKALATKWTAPGASTVWMSGKNSFLGGASTTGRHGYHSRIQQPTLIALWALPEEIFGLRSRRGREGGHSSQLTMGKGAPHHGKHLDGRK